VGGGGGGGEVGYNDIEGISNVQKEREA
jgi:hypothetical protein